MAKNKIQKRNLQYSSGKNGKDESSKKALNPFEVHINREKMQVLGRKRKNDVGLPGISRAKALLKRKHTLLPEYKLQYKNNEFADRRIGERNQYFTADDKSIVRYSAIRAKQHSKKKIFNLAEDEVLTHRGQALSEIEKFDDARSDDDDDEDENRGKSGNLESQFVKEAHFGGGMLKKAAADGIKSHNDLIQQLIIESKKRKFEKQKQKEETVELTEKLDTEWKDLLPLVSARKKSKVEDQKCQVQVDDYDKVMRELKFEARGTPSNKLKSDDEIAREEKEKLQKLERERLERMHGTIATSKTNHKSADDLEDNFAYNSDTTQVTLSYNHEGVSNLNLNNDDGKSVHQEDYDAAFSDEDDEEEVETDSDDNLSDLKEDDGDGSDENVDKIVDNKEQNDDDDDDLNNLDAIECKPNTSHQPMQVEQDAVNQIKIDAKEIKQDLLKRKLAMEKARAELPYTYSLPESYESLQSCLQNQSSHHQSIIIKRMIKCNHPSLNLANKDGLALLFVYLLQHLSDVASEATNESKIKECFNIFSATTPHFYDLAQLNPENAASSMLELIIEKQADFKKCKNKYPPLEVLLYLKLVSVLFSTSDFRHQVVTPCIVFMEQILSKCKINSRRDIAYGLFVTSLIIEYTMLSKRYLPSAMHYLCGVLHMAIPKNPIKLLKVIPPFKFNSSELVLHNNINLIDLKLNVHDLVTGSTIDDSFCARSINVAVALLQKSYANFHLYSSCLEIFKTALDYLKLIPLENYGKVLGGEILGLIKILDQYKTNRTLEFVVMEKKKPRALRLYEPNVVQVFDVKRHKVQSRVKADRDKLLHKIKKERKGALREIRGDKAFLGRIKINERIQSDRKRKEKVNQIYSEAATQQSELNAMDRKNSKKK